MNVNHELLQSAIVHQAVSAASVTILSQQLADAQQALAEKAKQVADMQSAVDALAADRKKVNASHAADMAELRAELDAANGKLVKLATSMDFPNVDAMLNAAGPAVTAAAPVPAESEGGETA